jgi:hypothetical protein
MMLTETWQCAHANNLLNRQSGGKLSLNNLPLVIKIAKSRHRYQHDPANVSLRKHGLPVCGGSPL